MGCVGLLGLARGRPASALPALGAAVTGLLLLDPWQARSYGFALSALATGALLLGAPPLVRALTGHGVPLRLAQALAVPVAAHLATAPVIALLSGSLSLVAVPANLVAEPFVAPATVLGVLVALVAAVSTPAGALLAHVAAVPAAVVVADAHASARLPAAVVPWPATLRGALVLAALAAVLPWSVRRFVRHRGVRIGALAAALALVAANLVAPRWPPPGWVFVVCDVGQGDALVLHAGPGTAVVVDAGPDPAPVDRCLRDLHVTRVDELVLTHFHADHVEGLPGVLHGRTVRELRTSPLREPPAEAARVDGWTRTRGIPSRPLTDGETGSDGSLRWQVLAPEAVRAGEDPNEASIVLLVEVAGLRLLLTGDVTPIAQQALHVGAPPLDRPVDVLKVPHHGSPHQDPVFLTAVHARLALVSVGVNNDYGHPSPETLALLSRAGALVARTDRQGDLAVLPGPSGPVLVPRHSAG